MIRTISMIGAGRLATSLGTELREKGFQFVQVMNKTEEKGRRLAELLHAQFAQYPSDLSPADLYIISVADEALPEICNNLRYLEGIVAHTSGTIPLDAIHQCSQRTGVLYPPQSFPLEKAVSYRGVTFCVEGSDPQTEQDLFEVAERISGKVARVRSEQRLWLHLSAAFASNFPNFMYAVAEELMKNSGLDMEILLPLINETAAHARSKDIFSLQTGPAAREDQNVIGKHLQLLKDFPEYKEIYQVMTSSIIKQKHRNDKL
jgi:predicted short-subunit dehydrogenase-like oxidoreductase (DUF2520 family)